MDWLDDGGRVGRRRRLDNAHASDDLHFKRPTQLKCKVGLKAVTRKRLGTDQFIASFAVASA
jgi:hypothetical protein